MQAENPAGESAANQAELAIVVAARDEAERIGATLEALRSAFADARVWVADDASSDETATIALRSGATLVGRGKPHGKGGNMTAACTAALETHGPGATYLLCDADLGASAGRLAPLLEAVREGRTELAVAAFERREGGGIGLARGYARRAIRRRAGIDAAAPISGQRALSGAALADALPFAAGFGMEVGMTIDAVRAGHRYLEIEVDLAHRATGRSVAGFAHRARQLREIAAAARERRARG